MPRNRLLRRSITASIFLFFFHATHAQQKIDMVEYGIDSIPAYGHGKQVTVSTPAANISNLAFNADISTVGSGLHVFFIRSRSSISGASGKWGITNFQYFYKMSNGAPPVSKIQKLEYFIDKDPGENAATPITVTPATQEVGVAFTPNIAALGTGFHTLLIRSLDENGKWSITNYQYFYKMSNGVVPISNIQKLEYFIDKDPGEGVATPITVTPAIQVAGITFNPNIGSLGTGFHVLFIRSLDENGKWSITNYQYFYKMSNGKVPYSEISKLEYFIDTDPGEGKAKPITVTPATNISGMAFNADLTSVATGFHTLFIRSLDENGKWSITNYQYFYRSFAGSKDTANIVKVEYFIDNDPGLNHATNIPVTPAPNISNQAFTANDIDTLSAGTHFLYVRSLDSRGNWSLTCDDSFDVSALPVTLLYFTAKPVGQNVQLNWQTTTEVNSNHFDVERSADAINFTKVGAVAAKGNSNTLISYAFEDVNVGSGIWFYRLKEVDNDGTYKYSNVQQVQIFAASSLIIYPNPANNVIHVLFSQSTKAQLKLFNVNGQLLQQVNVENALSKDVDVSNLASGVYLLQVISSTDNHTQKIIIQH